MGESAGGTLASIVGTTVGTDVFENGEYVGVSSEVKAVVDFYGIVDS